MSLKGRTERASLRRRARNARKRASGIGAGRYLPNEAQWMVLFALGDAGGMLPTGGVTTAGAHVHAHSAAALAAAGLVRIEHQCVFLTPLGSQRVRYRW